MAGDRARLPEAPAVRALAVHPQKPEIIYAGTQAGAYRSADRGEHWEKVVMPTTDCRCGRSVHPHDPDIILVGTENCEDLPQRRCRRALGPAPVSVPLSRDHHRARRQPAKRVLMLDASAAEPESSLRAIEVGARSGRLTAASIGRI